MIFKLFIRCLILVTLASSAFSADDNFYGTVGFRYYTQDNASLLNGVKSNLINSSSYYDVAVTGVTPSSSVIINLGYRFDPIKVHTGLEFSSLDIDYQEQWSYSTYQEHTTLRPLSLVGGISYEGKLTRNTFWDVGLEFGWNGQSLTGDRSYNLEYVDIKNSVALIFSLGYSAVSELGPFGIKVSTISGRDPYGTNNNSMATSFEVEMPGMFAGAVLAVVGTVAVVNAYAENGGGLGGGGDYSWAWDQFYDQYYNLVWRCRGMQTGQFANDYQCASKIKSDFTWPQK